MGDMKQQRRRLLVQYHFHSGNITATKDPDRRFAVTGLSFAADTLTVQETLHVGQEGDEFLVVPFLEIVGIAEFVVHFPPRALVPHRLQQFPIFGNVRFPHPRVHNLQGPQQNLPKVANDGSSVLCDLVHGVDSRGSRYGRG